MAEINYFVTCVAQSDASDERYRNGCCESCIADWKLLQTLYQCEICDSHGNVDGSSGFLGIARRANW